MRFERVADWLAWQETLHAAEIDLGLERVAAVADRLGVRQFESPVITVAGTNGKGSCIALLDAMLRAAGYRPATYTSPHLSRYNERIRVAGYPITDADLCEAFDAVDRARGGTALTYFEFGTLAALWHFHRVRPDAILLEVGLGGRLDAVNIVEPDCAILTTVGLDHADWLGPDRESVGREKAGIFRRGRPAICGDPVPPASVLDRADSPGVDLRLINRDFGVRGGGSSWDWWGRERSLKALPAPGLEGAHQRANAATALAGLDALGERLVVPEEAIREGLAAVELAGRMQRLRHAGVEWVFDVAHNPEAAARLAQWLESLPAGGRTRVVVGMQTGKDAAGVAEAMAPVADAWHAAGLEGSRARTGTGLADVIRASVPGARVHVHDDVRSACEAAADEVSGDDRVVVMGSFLTVAEGLVFVGGRGPQ